MITKIFRYRYPGFLSWGIFVLMNLSFLPLHANNKVLVKTWEASPYDALELLAENAYQVEVSTYRGTQIRVEARMEGEHSEQIIINSEAQDGVLRIQPGYQEFFHRPNDKLAAHKVISISLHLQVPENFRVLISAPKAHLEGEGTFKRLEVHLGSGNCFLIKFKGNANLHTESGSIDVTTSAEASGEAHSRQGKVVNTLSSVGFYTIKAQSVKGDISLRKTPE